MTYDDIKHFIDVVCFRYGFKHEIILDIDHRKKLWGSAKRSTCTLFVTKKLMLQCDEKIKQTVIHECIHIIHNIGHTPKFRRLQTEYLQSIGINPKYSGIRSTHIRRLFDMQTGKLIWDEGTCKRKDETITEYV